METSLILFGVSRAGTTTQASLLARQLRVPHLSIYHLLTFYKPERISLKPHLKRSTDSLQSPHTVVPTALGARLQRSDTRRGWILTEYPMTVSQAQDCDALLKHLRQPKPQAIFLDVPESVILERLQRISAAQSEAMAIAALAESRLQVAPLIEYYQHQGRLTPVNGNGSVAEVCDRILQAMQVPCY